MLTSFYLMMHCRELAPNDRKHSRQKQNADKTARSAQHKLRRRRRQLHSLENESKESIIAFLLLPLQMPGRIMPVTPHPHSPRKWRWHTRLSLTVRIWNEFAGSRNCPSTSTAQRHESVSTAYRWKCAPSTYARGRSGNARAPYGVVFPVV